MVPMESTHHRGTVIKTGIWRCNAQDPSKGRGKQRVKVSIEVDDGGMIPAESVIINLYKLAKDSPLISSTRITQDNFCGVATSHMQKTCKSLVILYKTEEGENKGILLKDGDGCPSVDELKCRFLQALLTERQIYENVEYDGEMRNLYVLRRRVVMCRLFSKTGGLPVCCWDSPVEALRRSYCRAGDAVYALKLSGADKQGAEITTFLKTKTSDDSEHINTTVQKFVSAMDRESRGSDCSSVDSEVGDSGSETAIADSSPSHADDSSPTISPPRVWVAHARAELIESPPIYARPGDSGDDSPASDAAAGAEAEEKSIGLSEACRRNSLLCNQDSQEDPVKPRCSCPSCISNLSATVRDMPVGMALHDNHYVNTQVYENNLTENEEITKAVPKRPPPPLPKRTYKKELTDMQRLIMLIDKRNDQDNDWFTFEELHQISELLSPVCPLGHDWRRLVDFAGISITELEGDIDAVAAHSGNLPAYLFLTLWRKVRPLDCNRQRVKDVLGDMGRYDVLRVVFKQD